MGMIHNSAVSCLLKDSLLLKASCVESYHGGSRCSASTTVPNVGLPHRTQGALLAPANNAEEIHGPYTQALECAFGVHHDAATEAVCQAIIGDQFSTNALNEASSFVGAFSHMIDV